MCVMKKRSFLDTESLSALEAVAIIVLFFALKHGFLIFDVHHH